MVVLGLVMPCLLAAQAPDAVRDRIRELTDQGEYGAALVLAERHGEHALAADVRVFRGEWDEAEAAYRRTLAAGQPDTLAARLGLAQLLELRGRREEARRAYDRFISVYNAARGRLGSDDLTAVATAVRHLSAWDPQLAHDALRAYDEAIALDSGNLQAHLGVGELFLSRYSAREAAGAFNEVLRRRPRHAAALLGLARTHRFAGAGDARDLVGRSLEVNPRSVAARTFLAQLHLEREDAAAAEAELHRALGVNPRAAEALATLAAVRFLTDDTTGYRDMVRRTLAVNPRYAGLYVTVAEAAARNRRYADAVRLGREAVALDSLAWRGWAVLGINQLRIGAMADGRRHLETAFRGDPFDLWTKNTLDLLDTLVTYRASTSQRFTFLVDGKESALLDLYLGPLADEAYERLAVRYGHRPATPIRVEVYPTHADFSVRTVGLAGLGALGVSFGPVIAMDSPSARDRGQFNWGSTLWHEIAHTFHLDLSAHRVPRWFTEGLAVHEEHQARQGWGDDVSPGFLLAYQHEQLRPVSRLNDGFLQPRSPQEIGYSYYLGSLVCELIERDHGPGAFRRMLLAWGGGRSTAQVFADVLGTTPEAFDRTFDRYVREKFARPLAALARADTAAPTAGRVAQDARRRPDDYLAQLRMGHAMMREGRSDGAVSYLERALELFPEYAGPDSPYPHLARIYATRGDWPRVVELLSRYTAINESAWEALLELARRRELLGDLRGAARALDASLYVSPLDPATHEHLADLSRRLNDTDREIRERRAVVALQPIDRPAALYRLARAYRDAGRRADARRTVLQALELAPAYAEAQELLLELAGNGGTE